MFENTLTRNTSFLSFAFALITMISIQPVSAKTLEGQINIDAQMHTKGGPSLNRSDAKRLGDPFSAPGSTLPSEQFDAPMGAFDSHPALMPPPPTFNLNADDHGGDFGGQPGIPSPGNYYSPPIHAASIPQNMLPPMQSQDPEMSENMQLQWDLWHKRVAEAIFVRFDAQAQKAFANSRPISCEASYTVTCNGQIKDVRLLHKSDSFMYNAMLIGVLNSMNGNPILQFPPGTRRQMVMKTGTFSRNCGVNGFKHTTNDNESIRRMR
jgi:hypothetical protein